MAKWTTGKRGRIRVAPKEKRTFEGIVFHSKREMIRWQELLLCERAGEITGLERQVEFPVKIGRKVVFRWFADFVYYDVKTKKRIVEDSKGHKTDVYKLKKKCVEAAYNITITET